MDKYSPAFRKTYDFMEKYINIAETGDFDAIAKDMSKARGPFECDLYAAVCKELDRIHKREGWVNVSL